MLCISYVYFEYSYLFLSCFYSYLTCNFYIPYAIYLEYVMHEQQLLLLSLKVRFDLISLSHMTHMQSLRALAINVNELSS